MIANSTYIDIIGAKLLNPINTTSTLLAARKKNLSLFSPQDKFLNFKLNIGISHINNQDVIIINPISETNPKKLKLFVTSLSCCPTLKDPQNKAFAGVGIPMNQQVCLVSMLNFASRRAEKADMRKAT